MKSLKGVVVRVYQSGAVSCFDESGEQVPELQKGVPVLWAEEAERNGYDPDGAEMDFGPNMTVKIVRTVAGFSWKMM